MTRNPQWVYSVDVPESETPPPQAYDHAMVKYLLVLIGMALVAILAAEALTDGDSSPVVLQIVAIVAPVSGLLMLTIKGGEVARSVRTVATKTDQQTTKIEKIEEAVNGRLDDRFKTLEDRIRELGDLIERRTPPPGED